MNGTPRAQDAQERRGTESTVLKEPAERPSAEPAKKVAPTHKSGEGGLNTNFV